MAFIARLDKPCTHCNVVIAKGTSGGFTWDRSGGGFIHSECLKLRKAEGGTPSPVDAESNCRLCTLPKVKGNRHYTGCEFYAEHADPVRICNECGMNATGHKATCSQYPAERCAECGVKDGSHYSTCSKYAGPKPDEEAKPEPAKKKVSLGVSNGAADELARIIQELAGKRGIDESAVRRIAADEASKVAVNRTITIKLADVPGVKFDLAHEDLPTVIRLASMRDDGGHRPNVYLYGPAGSGKSTAARQVSKALFPDAADKYGYISLNPQTPESRLIGYMHAGGEYVATEFFKKFTTGGVFCIDEIDNAAASLLATLNGLLANGHGAFPHGVFERHADFVCIATGNTIGLGGDVNYPERRPLDGATRDRFYFMAWGYDMELISAVLTGILGNGAAEFMQWVKRETQELQARYPTHIVSPRAYIQGASLEKIGGYTRNQIKDMVIARGLK